MWLLCNVAAIHELPLHIVTKAFSTIDVFKKPNCYEIQNINLLSLILTPLCQDGAFISRVPVMPYRKPDMPSGQREQNVPVRCRCGFLSNLLLFLRLL